MGIYYVQVMKMKKQWWKPYLAFIALAEGVGALSGWLSREGMQTFSDTVAQPPLSPPMWLFPVVWTVLYALMGFGAARAYGVLPGKDRSTGLNLFGVQLVVNFFWSLIFFNARNFGFAFYWLLLLLALAALMAFFFFRVDKWAGLAQIPYLLWLAFAAYLTFRIWQLNG